MEKIRRVNGQWFYGLRECETPNDAYCHFREDYYAALGKAYYRRLNMPARQERIHNSGIFVSPERYEELKERFKTGRRVPCWIMGFLGIGYARMVGAWDLGDYDERDTDDYMDWLFISGSNAISIVGRGDMAGRTSNRINKRYR